MESNVISFIDRCTEGSKPVASGVVNSPQRRKPKNLKVIAAQNILLSKSIGLAFKTALMSRKIAGVIRRRLVSASP